MEQGPLPLLRQNAEEEETKGYLQKSRSQYVGDFAKLNQLFWLVRHKRWCLWRLTSSVLLMPCKVKDLPERIRRINATINEQ